MYRSPALYLLKVALITLVG